MTRRSPETTLFALIGLAGATLIASSHLTAGPSAAAIVLGLAVLKGRLILLNFLGLGASSPAWRGLVTAWVVAVASFAWAASVVRLFI